MGGGVREGVALKDRLRILLTTPHLSPEASPYREMIEIARRLPRDEFTLTVCSLRADGEAETRPLIENLGGKVLVARFRPRGRLPRHFSSSLRDQVIIGRYGPFDIQHSLDFTSSPFEALAARWKSRAFLFTQRQLNEGGSATGLRLKIGLARRVIAIAGNVADFLRRNGAPAEKIRKVYLGIDAASLGSPGLRAEGPPYIMSVGHIQRRKRQEDAIRALALLGPEWQTARLGLIGAAYEPDYQAELKRLAAELGLSRRVDFLGSRSDVPQLMRRAHALIHCAESEAFGWVLLEAMATGLPVVAAAVDGPKEILDHRRTGLLVPVAQPAMFAAALRAVLTEPGLADSLACAGRRAVEERFTSQAMVDGVARVYRELGN